MLGGGFINDEISGRRSQINVQLNIDIGEVDRIVANIAGIHIVTDRGDYQIMPCAGKQQIVAGIPGQCIGSRGRNQVLDIGDMTAQVQLAINEQFNTPGLELDPHWCIADMDEVHDIDTGSAINGFTVGTP